MIVKRGGEGQFVLPNFEEEIEKIERELKRRFLAPFVTNLDGDIYALTGNLPPVLAAIVVARQSRAETFDARDLIWEELALTPELGLAEVRATLDRGVDAESLFKTDKAREKIRNIIDRFGDDSVREQASAYVMFQNMSVLATTFGMTHPLLTRIEASTRFIDWGKKDNGKFRYKELDWGGNEEAKNVYSTVMESCFSTYGELWDQVWTYVAKTNSREVGVSEVAYETAVRGRVCDDLRGLLPLSALTNFGLHGDFRSLSELIMNLAAEDNLEMKQMAEGMYQELRKINPEFVGVVENAHGKGWTKHRKEQNDYLVSEVSKIGLPDKAETEATVKIEVSTNDFLKDITLAYLDWLYPGIDKVRLRLEATYLARTGKMQNILDELGRMRKNRRHELPEFLREITVKIDIDNYSLGTLKDLFRHRRIIWRSKANLEGNRGEYVPLDIRAIGGTVLETYKQAQETAREGRQWMKDHKLKEAAEYMLLHGTKTNFEIRCDLLEALWISELRSIASGFEEYREVAQKLWHELIRELPELTTMGSFTDLTTNYPLGRVREAVRADVAERG